MSTSAVQASVAKPRPQCGAGDPIAHLDRAGRAPAKAAFADQLRRAGGPLEDEERGEDGVARRAQEGLGVADAKRPRRRRQVPHDRLVGNRRGKRGRVFREARPQQQSWRSREHRSSPHVRPRGSGR